MSLHTWGEMMRASMEYRVVRKSGGMGYYYRARIIASPSPVRRRPGYRYFIDSHFMGWYEDYRSHWVQDRDECERQANDYLDSIEAYANDGEPVGQSGEGT